jgi:peptide/nickel transport system substrate-binding protein
MGLSDSGTLVPVLAERYEISADQKVYTFTLREGVAFTNGAPLTAEDVVFTVRKAQDPGLKSPEYANWSGVSVFAENARTVRFTLSKPYAPFLGLTTLGILPSRLWQAISNEEFPFSNLETSPVGAGAFKVTSVSRDASGLIRSVLLSANPDYILGRPYLDHIRFNFYSRAEDLAAAVKNGKVESAYGISSGTTVRSSYARVFGVFWNPNERPVFARAEVRKALSLAIDRNAIITDALGGYATAIMGPVPPGERIAPVPLPNPQQRISDATEVLEKAGWTYDGVAHVWESPATLRQTLDRITLRTSNVPELKSVATVVQKSLESIGIAVDIELYEPSDLSQNVIRPRTYEALLYGMVIGRDQDLYAFWSSEERNDPGLNIAQYANKTVDDLLERVRTGGDEVQRIADLEKIQNLIAAEHPAAFLYAPDFIYTIPNDLKGVVLPQIITPSDRFANAASWYRVTDSVWPFLSKKQ